MPRFVITVLVMLVALGVMLGVQTVPAQALGDGTTHAGRFEHEQQTSQVWMGSYRLDDGRVAWCAFDPDARPPIYTPYTYSDWTREESFVSGNGHDLTGEVLQRAAYVLAQWGDTTDEFTARAVYRALHHHTGVGFSLQEGEQLTSDTAELADRMWDEAGRFGGPNELASPVLTSAAGGQRVQARLETPRGRSGEPVPGAVTATIEGPGVWEESGTREMTYTQDGEHSLRAISAGEITVTVARMVPGAHLLIAHPTSSEAQRLVASAEHVPITASAHADVVDRFQPRADTTARTWHPENSETGLETAVGDRLEDTLHVSATGSAPWLPRLDQDSPVPATFTVNWYYSPHALPRSDEVPSEAQHFDRVQLTVAGPGDHTAQSERVVDQPGWYYPVVSFERAAQPAEFVDQFAGDYAAPFHAEREQTIVPWHPTVTTVTSEIVEGQVTDTITVTGNDPSGELVVVSELWMSHERSQPEGLPEAPADAVRLASVETAIIGDGTVTTQPVDVPWSQFVDEPVWPSLYWVEHIERSASTERWDGRHLLPNETVEMLRPSATTQTEPRLTAGDSTTDQASVTGTIPVSNGSELVSTELSFSFYRFDDSTDGGAQPVCLSPEWTQPHPISVSAAGDFVSDAVTVAVPGTYGFRHHLSTTITSSATGGSPHDPATADRRVTVLDEGECGASGENVIVLPLPLPTGSEPLPSDTVSDSAGSLATTGVAGMMFLLCSGTGLIALGGLQMAMAARRRRMGT